MPSYVLSCGVDPNPICPVDPPAPAPASVGDGERLTDPNFVVIQFDDLGFGDFQYLGFGSARTPWINRISREGLSAERYFTSATVCSPSRYSMATGRDNAEDGVFTTITPLATNFDYNNVEGIPINVPTIYSELKGLGYHTAHHGKWHMGLDPALMDHLGYGLDEYSGWAFHNPGLPDATDQALLTSDRLMWEQTRDQRMTDRSCDFIRRCADSGDKFFLNLSLHAPHFPLYPSAAGMAAVSHLAGSAFFNGLDPNDERITSAQRYYAALYDADARVGEIYQCLQQRGELDNTIFIVTSDNGPLTNRNHTASPDQWGRVGSFRGMKNTVYNGGVRVPFIVRGPTIPAGYVPETATLSALDVMPTLIYMAGGTPPAGVDGQIMAARWQGADVDREKILHWLTIQNLPISIHVADRSPLIRGYYPAGTCDNNNPLSAYTNPDGVYPRVPEIYDNADHPELDNLHRELESDAKCGSLANRLVEKNQAWYDSLADPRLKPNAGRLEYRL